MRIVQKIQQKLNWSLRQYLFVLSIIFFSVYIISSIYHTVKPMPKGLNMTGEIHTAHIEFLYDQTVLDHTTGQQKQVQHIFPKMLEMIGQAQSTIVLDMFLFNAERLNSTVKHQALTEQLTTALLQRRREYPNLQVYILTDPINSFYGGLIPQHYVKLRQAGIEVIETDLTTLPASNPVWSGFWYMCCQFLGNNTQTGWLTSPFSQDKVTLRSYLTLLNFKANHRKVLVTDSPDGWQALISSANVHDGSSWHHNVALWVKSGAFASDVLKSEQAAARLSSAEVPSLVVGSSLDTDSSDQVQLFTEQAIYHKILTMINESSAGTQLDLMMFYLSERQIIQALKQAQQRGVKIRVLLDQNQDAFGRQKNGIPNQPVAYELMQAGITVRWCATHGEQCHSKLLLRSTGQQAELLLGSANFTARNLKNYNLESDVFVKTQINQPVFIQATHYFDQIWNNQNNQTLSVEYSHYANESSLKYWQYRFMEWSGFSTF